MTTELADPENPRVVRAYVATATRPETRRRLEWAADGAPGSASRS